MPARSKVYRVMIGSPSDLAQEEAAAYVFLPGLLRERPVVSTETLIRVDEVAESPTRLS
jgi:hypothetical protein